MTRAKKKTTKAKPSKARKPAPKAKPKTPTRKAAPARAAKGSTPPPPKKRATARVDGIFVPDLAIDRIDESPTNPRRDFKDLDTLADSIREVGVLEPVIVRAKGGNRLELVVGARRLRASKLAGRTTIPAMELALTDVEVIEIQIAENNQRSDVSPLEEGDAFQLLVTRHGRTVEDIAVKIGRPRAYVHQRLKLTTAASAVREMLERGQIGIGSAFLLAQLETDVQEKVAKALGKPPEYISGGQWSRGHVVSAIERISKVLERAPFDRNDKRLVPGAGACATCPRRTGAQVGLYEEEDVGDDRCLDTACWDSKVSATWDRKSDEAKRRGLRVLDGDEAKTFLRDQRPDLADESAWVLQNDEEEVPATDDEEEQVEPADPPKWRELARPEEVVLVRGAHGEAREYVTPEGRRRILAERAPQVLREEEKLERERRDRSPQYRPDGGTTTPAEYAIERKAVDKAKAACVAELVALAETDELKCYHRAVASALVSGLDYDAVHTLMLRRGWLTEAEDDDGVSFHDEEERFLGKIAPLDEPALRGVVLELALAHALDTFEDVDLDPGAATDRPNLFAHLVLEHRIDFAGHKERAIAAVRAEAEASAVAEQEAKKTGRSSKKGAAASEGQAAE